METFDQFVAAVRAFTPPADAKPEYEHCGLCGRSLWALPVGEYDPTKRYVCGHRVHTTCTYRYPESQTCGHCLDELQAAREAGAVV